MSSGAGTDMGRLLARGTIADRLEPILRSAPGSTAGAILIGMVALGHPLGGLRGLRFEVLSVPAPLRAAVYLTAIFCWSSLVSWRTILIIYFQF